MTTHHECRNCRWSVLKFNNEIQCANIRSEKTRLPWVLGVSAGNMNGRRKGTGTMLDFGFYNMDCMDGMKEFPDGFFDLAVVDPPYGISITGTDVRGGADRRRKTIW